MRSSNSTANNSSTADLGGGTRAKLQEFLGRKELDKHLDADEATVLGASLHAANISDGIKLNRKLGMIDGSMYGFVINVRINAFQKCVHCIYEERISEMRSLYFFGGRSAAGTGYFKAFEKCVPRIIRGTHFAREQGDVDLDAIQTGGTQSPLGGITPSIMPTASIQIVGTQTPIGVNPAAKATAVDTAAIHRKPNPRCKNLKQSVGTQVTARPDKLIPRKKKINETATTLQGDGSEPVVPLGIEKAGPKSKPASSRAWYSTPELKRKKRIAKYKLYLIEARMKDSLRKEFRSFKRRLPLIKCRAGEVSACLEDNSAIDGGVSTLLRVVPVTKITDAKSETSSSEGGKNIIQSKNNEEVYTPRSVEFDESCAILADLLLEVLFSQNDDVVGEGRREEQSYDCQCCADPRSRHFLLVRKISLFSGVDGVDDDEPVPRSGPKSSVLSKN
nr:heat shock 70 kDa protein 17 [Ipomoea batatas]